MELISKVDIDGSFEVTDTLRAIGVSSSNLVPNDKGIVPLSNQSALIIEQPASSLETGVITEKPIDVASPDSLESLDLGSIIPEKKETPVEPAPAVQESAPVQSEVLDIKLPPIEAVQAEAPKVVPAGLFIDGGGVPEEEIKLVNPMEETVLAENTPAASAETVAPAVPEALTPTQVVETPVVETPTAVLPEVQAPVVETPAPVTQEVAPVQAETSTELPEMPVLDTIAPAVEASTPAQVKEEPASVAVDLPVIENAVETQESVSEEKSDFKFETPEDVENYVNKLIDEMEKKHQEELAIFRNNVVKTCKFLFDNKEKKIDDSSEEMVAAIPSLESATLQPAVASAPTTVAPTPDVATPPLDIPVLGEIATVDSEEIKPKFVL